MVVWGVYSARITAPPSGPRQTGSPEPSRLFRPFTWLSLQIFTGLSKVFHKTRISHLMQVCLISSEISKLCTTIWMHKYKADSHVHTWISRNRILYKSWTSLDLYKMKIARRAFSASQPSPNLIPNIRLYFIQGGGNESFIGSAVYHPPGIDTYIHKLYSTYIHA